MKREFLSSSVFVLIVVMFLGLLGTMESTYKREGVVIKANSKTQEVVVVDKIGHTWAFYGDGFCVDDKVVMTMYNNHTEDIIEDDIIRGARVK